MERSSSHAWGLAAETGVAHWARAEYEGDWSWEGAGGGVWEASSPQALAILSSLVSPQPASLHSQSRRRKCICGSPFHETTWGLPSLVLVGKLWA